MCYVLHWSCLLTSCYPSITKSVTASLNISLPSYPLNTNTLYTCATNTHTHTRKVRGVFFLPHDLGLSQFVWCFLHKIFQTSGKMHTCTHQLCCCPPCSPYCLADSPLQTLCFLRVHLWCSSNGCSHPAGLATACFYGLIAVSVPWRTTTIVGFAETPLIPNPALGKLTARALGFLQSPRTPTLKAKLFSVQPLNSTSLVSHVKCSIKRGAGLWNADLHLQFQSESLSQEDKRLAHLLPFASELWSL